jgi:hypothetical protein
LNPTVSRDLRLDVQHRIEAGTFKPATYFLENGGKPFRARFATTAWLAGVLNEMDGTRTLREVFRNARARGWIPDDFAEANLEALTCSLVERGIVDVPWELAMPAAS